ncbi:MAG TPA: GNAT family N-acetyltransferase, partial [Solirubrobacteraceae bacterium]|nr:GNAT family N-acetyltransferase [Solirubrobacteraceae bacterium]
SWRGRGLGVELVREVVDTDFGPNVRWLLHTADAQGLYEKLGFSGATSSYPLMQRGIGPGAGNRAGEARPE